MISAFWAFDGFNNVGFLAGEIQHPEKNIPRALLFGVLSVLGIYLLINFAYLYALPFQNILAIGEKGHNIFAVEWAEQIAGPTWSLFVSLLILISAFGATNGSLMSSSRIYFAMAEYKLFFASFKKVHPKFHTPYVALLAQGIWASSLVFTGSFDDLTDWLIFAAFIFYGLGAFSLFRLRKLHVGKPHYQAPTWIVMFYILFCVALVLVNIYQNPIQSMAGLGLISLGLPVYIWLKRSAKTVT
jgi:APA family basic amino acid/polyamine antiporter